MQNPHEVKLVHMFKLSPAQTKIQLSLTRSERKILNAISVKKGRFL